MEGNPEVHSANYWLHWDVIGEGDRGWIVVAARRRMWERGRCRPPSLPAEPRHYLHWLCIKLNSPLLTINQLSHIMSALNFIGEPGIHFSEWNRVTDAQSDIAPTTMALFVLDHCWALISLCQHVAQAIICQKLQLMLFVIVRFGLPGQKRDSSKFKWLCSSSTEPSGPFHADSRSFLLSMIFWEDVSVFWDHDRLFEAIWEVWIMSKFWSALKHAWDWDLWGNHIWKVTNAAQVPPF